MHLPLYSCASGSLNDGDLAKVWTLLGNLYRPVWLMRFCVALQQWGDDGGDSGSSDGRGSSYFSGERVERDKSGSASPLAQDSRADLGAAAQQVRPAKPCI